MRVKFRIGIAIAVACVTLRAQSAHRQEDPPSVTGAGFTVQTSGDGKALKVYVGDHDAVVCMDAQTGHLLWRARTPYGTVDVGPILEDGTLVYVGGGGHFTIYGLDPATGRQKWSRQHRADLLVAGGGRIFANTQSGLGLSAFDAKTGKQEWVFDYGPGGSVDRLLYSAGCVYTTNYILNAATGSLVSRSQAALRALIARGETVFMADIDDNLLAITPPSQAPRWKMQAGTNQEVVGLAGNENEVFVALYDGYPDSAHAGIIQAYSAHEGKALWKRELVTRTGALLRNPIAADVNSLYVLLPGRSGNETNLEAWNALSGGKKWAYANSSGIVGPVAIVGSEIYANDLAGQIYVIEAESGALLRTLAYRGRTIAGR